MALRVARSKALALALSCADAAVPVSRAVAAVPVSRAVAAVPVSRADAAVAFSRVSRDDAAVAVSRADAAQALAAAFTRADAAPLAGVLGLLSSTPRVAPAPSPRQPVVGSRLGLSKARLSGTAVIPRWFSTAASNASSDQQEMTLDEFEKVMEEKRKALLALKKSEERKVEINKDLQAMQLLSTKKGNDEIFIKLGADKDAKKKENAERDDRAKKVVHSQTVSIWKNVTSKTLRAPCTYRVIFCSSSCPPILLARAEYTTSARSIGPIGLDGLPIAVDWEERGAVTPVSDQGNCGDCYAFATTVSTEGINCIKTGKLVKLSEQQLLDCVNLNNLGCNGGIPETCFDYIIDNGGQVSYADYPYVGYQSQPKAIWSVGVTIDAYCSYNNISEALLKEFVAQQPVVAAIGFDKAFSEYTTGVMDGPNYTCEQLNTWNPKTKTYLGHWVAIIAYGETIAGKKFWRVKNSHGQHWGEEGGYAYIARETGKDGGAFGICRFVSFPVKWSQNKICKVRNETELGTPKWR